MQRLGFLAVLIALTSSAYAGSISFRVGSHQVHIERQRHCRSASCASVSISRSLDWRRKRIDDERDTGVVPKPAPPAPQTVSPPAAPAPSAPPATTAPANAVVAASPPTVYRPAATRGEIVAAPPSPPPPAPPPVQQVTIPSPPAPEVEQVSHQSEEEPKDSPIGDWLTEGKGTVRIAKCGHSLCGYVLTSSNEKGEAILINMKPKKERQWTGSVYSQDSGETYYGTMAMKGINTLRVEACALGRFYCSGNNWSRITRRAENLVGLRGAPRVA